MSRLGRLAPYMAAGLAGALTSLYAFQPLIQDSHKKAQENVQTPEPPAVHRSSDAPLAGKETA